LSLLGIEPRRLGLVGRLLTLSTILSSIHG